MEANICPYLGLINDPNTSTTFPDANNACHQAKPPALVKLDYQNSTCLHDIHKECPGYISPWRDGLPKSIRRRKSIINPAAIDRLPWLLAAIPVILFIWAGFSGRLSFLSLDFRPRSASTPTSHPFFTRTPTAILTHTVTLTATETPLPLTETPTLTKTLTRTETPIPTITPFMGILASSTPVSTNPPSQPPTRTSTKRPTQPPTQPPTESPTQPLVPTQTPVTPSPTQPPPPTPTQTLSPTADMRPTNTPRP